MKQNYTTTSTVIGGAKSDVFITLSDVLKRNDQGKGIEIIGYFSHDKSKFGKSFSLVSKIDNNIVNINIPKWLGEKIDEDYKAEGTTPEKYFDGVSINEIKEIDTPNGKTYDIIFNVKEQ